MYQSINLPPSWLLTYNRGWKEMNMRRVEMIDNFWLPCPGQPATVFET